MSNAFHTQASRRLPAPSTLPPPLFARADRWLGPAWKLSVCALLTACGGGGGNDGAPSGACFNSDLSQCSVMTSASKCLSTPTGAHFFDTITCPPGSKPLPVHGL
jgi:hypothetical protein